MSWFCEQPPKRRPILLVEDHLYHIEEVLVLLGQSAPQLMPLLTIACLDRPGPDTDRSLRDWLKRFPETRWVAATQEVQDPRLEPLDPVVFGRQHELTKALAHHLRPGGLLLQDVQLETLTFIPRDRWWDSIHLAASIRGLFADRAPCCRFLSNKKGYEATFGVDLLEAGFDPRDVIDKRLLEKLLIPTITTFLDRRFPFELRSADSGRSSISVVGLEAEDQAEVESCLDLILWDLPGRPELGGRLVKGRGRASRLKLKPSCQELVTWRNLLDDLLQEGQGIPVLEVGRRAAPELAGRAEITNCAARHIHLLRSRLSQGDAVQTVDHAYRLDRRLSVALACDPSQPPPTS